ncbi:MAG: DEAD/DEAH box helicase [bacterium]
MSNKTSSVKQSLARFCDVLNKKAAQSHNTLSLNLSRRQKALLAAYWPAPNIRKIVIVDASPAQAQKLLNNISTWNKQLDLDQHWHLISGQLSAQETSGQITTSLSRALHALLDSRHRNHHFVLPASLLNTSLPDPIQYRQQHITLTVGEDHSIQQLTKKLINLGYLRQHRQAEPGTFVIKGENIIINHPYRPQRHALTFHRRTIEQIIRVGKRNKIINQITLPPLGFPRNTTTWDTLLKNSLAIRPSHLTNITAHYTIIDDALHPDILFPNSITNLISEDLLPSQSQPPSPITYQRGLELIQSLTVEQPAVHSDHGIGIYEGLIQRNIGGITREYLVLRYAEGDSLSVPVTFAHKVTAYIGQGKPPLGRLSDTAWKTTKRKASVNAALLARELLHLARKRHKATRPRYIIDWATNTTLDKNFPYTLTPDQIQTWQDVQHDFIQAQPMDRLLVGDVGFGKTEIAIRAAYLAATNNRQVALLAPTTLLVQQHFDTLKSRLPHLANKIALLSRFSTPTEQARVRQGMADGTIAIVVGTHGLISPHIKWQALSLAIIDEEQRFGVEQKESFKKLRASIDILSLSATPIPRTLSLALSNLKTLSIISTPPAGRKGVTITVSHDNDAIIVKAIRYELSRHGQVYVVAPRVRQLPSLQERLRALLPNTRLSVAHGQMPDADLAATMHRFDTGQIDVLVTSTIIESGLDLPNANTIIVVNATHFGLSDLYQLRGRIGRRERQGHAYFLYSSQRLTPLQRHRLTALTEASRLGSGWQLARRDLELRGAGNLLGAEQSGAIQGVGLALYLDLVKEATQKEQGDFVSQHEVDIHLPLAAAIPTDYIPDLTERTGWYGRLTRARSPEQLAEHTQKLARTYGPLPLEAANFILQLKLRQVAAQLGITGLGSITISPPGKIPFQRLSIKGSNLSKILPFLARSAPWQMQGNTLILKTANITPRLVRQLLLELERVSRHSDHQYKQQKLPLAAAGDS